VKWQVNARGNGGRRQGPEAWRNLNRRQTIKPQQAGPTAGAKPEATVQNPQLQATWAGGGGRQDPNAFRRQVAAARQVTAERQAKRGRRKAMEPICGNLRGNARARAAAAGAEPER